MKKIFVILLMCCTGLVYGQTEYPQPPPMTPQMTEFWTPQPPVVQPGRLPCDFLIPAPSDAIVLFDGTDLLKWEKASAVQGKDMSTEAARWTVSNGVLTVNKEAGDIQTKQVFGDFQLHIEWRIPEGITGKSQGRGNSGVFLQGIYEVQVLDSYENETYANGQAGSIYKQTAPLVNAMRPPGEWNSYDIIYAAPTFKADGAYRTRPTVTILHNGILIQNNTAIMGTTPFIGLPQVREHGKGPVRLQSHGDPSEPISFRNIWIREL